MSLQCLAQQAQSSLCLTFGWLTYVAYQHEGSCGKEQIGLNGKRSGDHSLLGRGQCAIWEQCPVASFKIPSEINMDNWRRKTNISETSFWEIGVIKRRHSDAVAQGRG